MQLSSRLPRAATTKPSGRSFRRTTVSDTRSERPLETLAAILRMPYALSRGYYFWPFAYDVADVNDLTTHERKLLAPLGRLDRLFAEGTGYLGWRAGISPDGAWSFFVAGD